MDITQIGLKKPDRSPKNTLAGTVDDLEESYGRNIPIPWLALLPILLLAALGILPIVLVNRARGKSSASFGDGRSLKELRAGPEISITPLWIRDDDGRVHEVEIHGYVRSDRIQVGDLVEVLLKRPLRKGHVDRVHVVENHTTGQTIRSHPATFFWHIGIPMVLQAGIGVSLLVAIIALAAMSS